MSTAALLQAIDESVAVVAVLEPGVFESAVIGATEHARDAGIPIVALHDAEWGKLVAWETRHPHLFRDPVAFTGAESADELLAAVRAAVGVVPDWLAAHDGVILS